MSNTGNATTKFYIDGERKLITWNNNMQTDINYNARETAITMSG